MCLWIRTRARAYVYDEIFSFFYESVQDSYTERPTTIYRFRLFDKRKRWPYKTPLGEALDQLKISTVWGNVEEKKKHFNFSIDQQWKRNSKREREGQPFDVCVFFFRNTV